MDLGTRLETGEAFKEALVLLKSCSKSDPFVATIIDGVDDGLAQNGVKTRLQLAEQLLEVRETARSCLWFRKTAAACSRMVFRTRRRSSASRTHPMKARKASRVPSPRQIHTWLPASSCSPQASAHKRSGGYKSRRFCERVGAECSRARPIRASTNRVKRSRAMQSIGACLETAL